jgi:nitrate/nitrite transport system substrate-binding protein
MWLDADGNANRAEAVKILSRGPNYVGADAAVIANSMTGTFEYEKGDKRPVPDFNVFFRHFATYPFYSDADLVPDPDAPLGPDRREPARRLVRRDRPGWSIAPTSIWKRPASWSPPVRRRRPTSPGAVTATSLPTDFIDGVSYDGRQPNAYVDSLAIGLKAGDVVEAVANR